MTRRTPDDERLIRTYLDRYNERAWDRLTELLDPGYVHHSNDDDLDAQQFVDGAEWFWARLPDLRLEVLDLIAARDRVAVRYRLTGTHDTSFFGETPTGRTLGLPGITIFRIADGRIAEDWEAMDEADLRRKVGAPDAG